HLRNHPWAFLISALIGSFTHLFWDSFTHPAGYFVKRLAFYDNVVPYEGVNYPLYYALQHISTFAGLLTVILYMCLIKPDPTILPRRPQFVYWLAIMIIVLIIMYLRLGVHWRMEQDGDIVVTSISGLCCALIVCGFPKLKEATT